jgi:hypothetical protein
VPFYIGSTMNAPSFITTHKQYNAKSWNHTKTKLRAFNRVHQQITEGTMLQEICKTSTEIFLRGASCVLSAKNYLDLYSIV